MTPAEVREVMRRLWSNDSRILRQLYGSNPLTALGSKNRAAKALQKTGGVDGYQMFFLQTIAVPPNNVRPLSRMGEMTLDHPQNIAFTQVRRHTQFRSDPLLKGKLRATCLL